MEVYQRLRDIREDADKTQEEIARLLDTTRQQYGKYENNVQEIPVRHLITLAQHYNVSLDYICGLTNNKTPLYSKTAKYIENGNHNQDRRASL